MSREPVDNRMVRCVLRDYEQCAAKVPEACICFQYQKVPDPRFGNMYEREYFRKYGEDQ